MKQEHPNMSLVRQFSESIFNNFEGAEEILDRDFVWHYVNPRVRRLEGDYRGLNGVRIFFKNLKNVTDNTFEIEPISIVPFGEEFVVSHANLKLTLESMQIETESVILWRVHDGRIFEAWDIPAILSLPVEAPQAR
jgi:hypothetical protein